MFPDEIRTNGWRAAGAASGLSMRSGVSRWVAASPHARMASQHFTKGRSVRGVTDGALYLSTNKVRDLSEIEKRKGALTLVGP
jgi:hypothetical protein